MKGLIALLSLTACMHHSPEGDDDGIADPTPTHPAANGSYSVRSQVDVTVEALLPEPAYELVGTLRDFSTAPAHTLFDLAEAAGVPVVAELRDALPAALESRLEGWIDDQIVKVAINGVPVTQVAGEIAALAETALTQFALDSTLAINGTHATHTMKSIDFTPAGIDVTIALDDLPADIGSAVTTATCTGNQLALGDHRFGLPYGQYAWRALESAVTAQYGKGVRGLLGAAVNCPAVASSVANKCVLGVCVGHRTELIELCERGLDEVVSIAKQKVEAVRFDAIHLAAGSATLVDDTHDGIADRLTTGVWTAEINAGQGLRAVPATFTAQR